MAASNGLELEPRRNSRKKYLVLGLLALLLVAAVLGGVYGSRSRNRSKSSSSSSPLTPEATPPQAQDTNTQPSVKSEDATPEPSQQQQQTGDKSQPTVPGPLINLLPSNPADVPIPTGDLSSDGSSPGLNGMIDQLVSNATQGGLADKAGGVTTCNPATGADLKAAIKQGCSFIKLKPGATYDMGTTETEITYSVAIVGHPLHPPLIDGKKAERIFNVKPGGYLDLKFVMVYRGKGRPLTPDIAVVKGGTALVWPGAGANFFSVIFTSPLPAAPDIKGQISFGGQLLIAGGVVRLTNCHFITLAPYNVRFLAFVGGDTLLAGGVLLETGCTHLQVALIVIGAGAGTFTAVLGGVAIMTGVVHSRVVGANGIAGAGIQNFIGAGVAIYTGCVFNTNGGLFSFFGSAVHQFLGAGVLVNTGVVSEFNFGLTTPMGTGFFITLDAGVLISTGDVYAISTGAQFTAGAGSQVFIGAGEGVFVGSVFNRNIGMLSGWGIGGTVALLAGDLEIINCPQAIAVGMGATAFLGLQYYVGAGRLFISRSPAARVVGLFYRGGNGAAAYVGHGNLTVEYTTDIVLGKFGYATPNQSKYWANGKAYMPVLVPPPDDDRVLLNKAVEFGDVKRRVLDLPAADGGHVCMNGVTSVDAKNGVAKLEDVFSGLKTTVDDDYVTNLKNMGFKIDCKTPLAYVGKGSCSGQDATRKGCDDADNFLMGEDDVQHATCPAGKCSLFDTFTPLLPGANAAAQPSNRRRVVTTTSGDVSKDRMLYMLRADLQMTCFEVGGCSTGNIALKDAVKALLSSEGNSVKVSVSPQTVDPIVEEFFPAQSNVSGDSTCPGLATYDVYLVSEVSSAVTSSKAKLLALNSDSNAQAAFVKALKDANVDACALSAAISWEHSVSINPDAASASGDPAYGSLAPTITVMDSKSKALSDLKAGGTYTISFGGFPISSQLVFTMTGPKDGDTKDTIIGTANAQKGSGAFVYTIPDGTTDGEYFFSAEPVLMQNFVALTPAVSIKS